MSHNIANTSTSTSALTASLPTVEQVKAWSRDDVKTFLQGNITRLDLEGEDIDKIYTQRVKGSTFLVLTRDDLLAIKIPLGPAKEIEKLINEIKRGKRTSFSPTPCHIRQQYRILTYSCAFLSCFLSSNPPKKHFRVIVEQPVGGKWVVIKVSRT